MSSWRRETAALALYPRPEPTCRRKRADTAWLMVRLLAFSLVVSLTSVACSPTAPDQQPPWGSDQASLTIDQNKATLQIVASGGCYGSFGEIENGSSLSGTFARSGTYTELTGAYPGSRQYAAEYTGTVAGNHMTLSVSVPALQQILGPFSLTSGVEKAWPACRYP